MMAEWRGPRAGRCSSSPRLNLHGWNAGKLRKPRDPEDPTIKRDPSLLSNYLILIFLAFLACPPPSPPLPFSSILHLSFFFGRKEGFFDPKREKFDDFKYPLSPFFFGFLLARRESLRIYIYCFFDESIIILNYRTKIIIFKEYDFYVGGLSIYFAKLQWIIEFSVS